MDRSVKKVYGVGINDSNSASQKAKLIEGKFVVYWRCPYYMRWIDMLERCYSALYQKTKKTYKDCTVCEEWLRFSNFKSWMETQDWVEKELDKDLLIDGNKLYSPSTCCFINKRTNSFIRKDAITGSKFPGVHWRKDRQHYSVRCTNSFTGKYEALGAFECPKEAYKAWLERKHEIACKLAEFETESSVIIALTSRYKNRLELLG